MKRTLVRGAASLILLVMGIGVVASAPPVRAAGGAASDCRPDMATETGTCATPVDARPATATQLRQTVEKEQKVTDLLADGGAHTPQLKSRQTVGSLMPPPGDSSGGFFKMPEVVNMDIWKEGEGNDKKSYTCGPSATRNMIAAMYKHRDGYYRDFGEDTIAGWEGTTTDGTAVGNIATALNNHMSSFGHWTTHKATDRDDYLANVAVDTYQYHQAVIVNVDTEEYSFFNGKALNHFDFVYGWDDTDAAHRFVYVAEEWDPIFIYGSSSYGDPYGRHKEPLLNAFRAEDKTDFHKMVV